MRTCVCASKTQGQDGDVVHWYNEHLTCTGPWAQSLALPKILQIYNIYDSL